MIHLWCLWFKIYNLNWKLLLLVGHIFCGNFMELKIDFNAIILRKKISRDYMAKQKIFSIYFDEIPVQNSPFWK